jgi:hypothetical protein
MKAMTPTTAIVALFGLLAHADGRAQQPLDDAYREAAERIVAAALADEVGWQKLTYLCDRIGSRPTGSEALARAVDWAAETMRGDGLENVQKLPLRAPVWVRGREAAELVEPVRKPLALLGLGGSVGTPPDGVTAPLVVAENFEALEALGRAQVEGKIVLFNEPYLGYGRTVTYRSSGASRAAKLGAVAALIRSVASGSLYTPHTGMLRYDEGVPQIPAAALATEDADWLHRLSAAGVPLRLHLQMEARTLPEAEVHNVVGEIPGRERPEEIVVLGGHIDSWDVGQGAHDDGVGVAAAMQAVALLKKLGLRPRRTLRVVLWTNEEAGLRGALAYRDWAGDSVSRHVAAIEADSGGEEPVGFGVGLTAALRDNPEAAAIKERVRARLRQAGWLLAPIGAGEISDGGGGADIGPLMQRGVPGLGLRTVGERYFEWHHTNADTLDKIDPENFRRQVAALAVMAYVLADMPDRLLPPQR